MWLQPNTQQFVSSATCQPTRTASAGDCPTTHINCATSRFAPLQTQQSSISRKIIRMSHTNWTLLAIKRVNTLKTWWNFAMAAKLCEKLFEPKFNNVWTKTSIFNGLYVISTISLSFSGFGRSLRMFNTSSAVHFWRMAWTSWCAVVVPGNEAVYRKEIEGKGCVKRYSNFF